MIGKVFGRWTVIEFSYKNKSNKKYYKCRCECGIEKNVSRSNLVTGHSKSCGCYALEVKQNRKKNVYVEYDEYVSVKASNYNKYFTCDIDDWNNLKEFTFSIDSDLGYPCSHYNGKYSRLHVLIMNPDKGFVVDHIDGNKLNNRRNNLRVCTQMENTWNSKKGVLNTSGRIGVWWNKTRNRWYAELKCNGEKHYLGSYINFDDAIKARQDAEIKYFGEYRRVI